MDPCEDPPSTPVDRPTSNGTSIQIPVTTNGMLFSHKASLGSTGSMEDMEEEEDPKHPRRGCCAKGGALRENVLTLLTFAAVVLGIGLGFALRNSRTWTKREVMYVNFPGELFLRMLRCLILPLIVSSLVSAVGGLDVKLSGKIGGRAVAYYMCTTIIAIIIGIILVVSIRPGGGATDDSMTNQTERFKKYTVTEDTLMDLVRNMFPPNIIEACIDQYSTVLIKPDGVNVSVDPSSMRTWDWKGKMEGDSNILGLVVFSVILGITLGRMKQGGKPLLDVFTSLSNAMMIITKLVIWLSPVGVLFLVASKIIAIEDLSQIAGQVGLYTLTVLVGLFLHGMVILPVMFLVLVRRNPYIFMAKMGQALATAFGTASSSATLPVTINCLEEKNGVDPRVARFCLPIGATINMDGTALYEAVAAIFIAQVRGLTLSAGNVIAISITATAASVGAAGIPQAGVVTMVMVLNVLGLPAEDVTLILIVDWMLDRFRTLINVLGDAYGSGIVAHYSVKDLEKHASDDTHLEMTNL